MGDVINEMTFLGGRTDISGVLVGCPYSGLEMFLDGRIWFLPAGMGAGL
jgi:hypothetical protein